MQATDTEGRDLGGFKRIQAHKSGPFDFENIQFAQAGHPTVKWLECLFGS